MKTIAIFLLLCGSALAQTITAGMTAAQVQNVLSTATCGQVITVQAQNSASQAIYSAAGGWTLPEVANCQGAVLSLTTSGGSVTGCTITQAGAGFTSNPQVTTYGDALMGKVNQETFPTITVTESGGSVNTCTIVNGGSNLSWAAAVVTGGGNEITLETDHVGNLPPCTHYPDNCRRIQQSNYTTYQPFMPVFTETSANGPIFIGPSGSNGTPWHIIGIEFYPTTAVTSPVPNLVETSTGTETNFALDRVFIHGRYWPSTVNQPAPYLDNCYIAFDDTGSSTVVVGSLIACWGVRGVTNLAVNLAVKKPIHYVVNNAFEAWYSQFYSGGDVEDEQDINPATITGSQPTIGSPTTTGTATITCVSPCDITTLPINTPVSFQMVNAGPRVSLTSISRDATGLISATCASACGLINGAQVSIQHVSDSTFNTAGSGSITQDCGTSACQGYGPVITSGPTSTTFQLMTKYTSVSTPTGGDVGPSYCVNDINAHGANGNGECFANTLVTAVTSLGGGQYQLTYNGMYGWKWYTLGGTYPPTFNSSSEYLSNLTPNPDFIIGGRVQWLGPHTTYIYWAHNSDTVNTAFATFQVNNNGNICKGYLEPKDGQYWRISGNVWSGWPCGMALNPVSSDLSSPWDGFSYIGMDNNWIQRFGYDLFQPGSGCEYAYCNGNSGNVHYENNLLELPDNANLNLGGNLAFTTESKAPSFGYWVQHNTVTYGYNGAAYGSVYTCTTQTTNGDCYSSFFGVYDYNNAIPGTFNFTWKDNIFGYGLYGTQCKNAATGIITNPMNPNCWSPYTESNNMVVLNENPPNITGTVQSTAFGAASDIIVNSWTNESPSAVYSGWKANAVRMQNPNNHDYRLCAAAGGNCVGVSAGHNKASDGTDIGVNYTTLIANLGPDNPSPLGPAPVVLPAPYIGHQTIFFKSASLLSSPIHPLPFKQFLVRADPFKW